VQLVRAWEVLEEHTALAETTRAVVHAVWRFAEQFL
jgi:hypothetical protein